jgi:hypothetical protein
VILHLILQNLKSFNIGLNLWRLKFRPTCISYFLHVGLHLCFRLVLGLMRLMRLIFVCSPRWAGDTMWSSHNNLKSHHVVINQGHTSKFSWLLKFLLDGGTKRLRIFRCSSFVKCIFYSFPLWNSNKFSSHQRFSPFLWVRSRGMTIRDLLIILPIIDR